MAEPQQTNQASSSGGSGGLFGNASANLGDVGVGTVDMGPTVQTSGAKTFSFAGPTINKGAPEWFYLAILAAVGFGGFYVMKRR